MDVAKFCHCLEMMQWLLCAFNLVLGKENTFLGISLRAGKSCGSILSADSLLSRIGSHNPEPFMLRHCPQGTFPIVLEQSASFLFKCANLFSNDTCFLCAHFFCKFKLVHVPLAKESCIFHICMLSVIRNLSKSSEQQLCHSPDVVTS